MGEGKVIIPTLQRGNIKLCCFVLAAVFSAGSLFPLDAADAVSVEPAARSDKKREAVVTDMTPQKRPGVSMPFALALDTVVPGGGHFYIGEYVWGAGFAAAKIGGACTFYYFYKEWVYKRSLYQAASKANDALDPTHYLSFKAPDGSYKAVWEYKRDYDRAAEKMAFAAIGNAAVYVFSWAMTYYHVDKINERTIPAFEVGLALGRDGMPEAAVYTGLTLRF